jgi:hypothetical protein
LLTTLVGAEVVVAAAAEEVGVGTVLGSTTTTAVDGELELVDEILVEPSAVGL